MTMVDAVKKLHTLMIETQRAYEQAQSHTAEPSLRTLFGEMAALRRRDHDALLRVLTDMGEKPDGDVYLSTVHRSAIAVRAAVTGLGVEALASLARGEENIVREYDDALGQDDIQVATWELLTRQRTALCAKIAEMRQMANSR